MQDIYEYIFKRKSVRKYKNITLNIGELAKIQERIDMLLPLYSHIKCSVEIRSTVKSFLKRGASHFIVFISEEKDGYLENIGFLGQQLDLYFSSHGLAACWLGMSKAAQSEDLTFIISIAIGYPDEPLHRNISEFKRKNISEISEGNDQRLEAARFAPSSANSQNWYFVASDGAIHTYRKKLGFVRNYIMCKFNCIDIGIALYHIYLATKHIDHTKGFNFFKEKEYPEKHGYIYMGTVESIILS